MASENTILKDNPFDGLKGCGTYRRTKLSDIKRENAYNDIINNIGWERFKYNGFPEEANTLTNEMIERAVLCGCGVVYKVPEILNSSSSGMYVCTPVEWVGVKKADNTADRFITYLPNGDYATTGGFAQIDSGQLKDFVIIKNNFEMTSDYDFTEWTAAMLNETDISEMQLIKWSRMTPIAKCIDSTSAAQIENILKRVYNGEPWAVMSDFSKILANGSAASRDDTVLRLSDETAIERMHFLSEFHYELIRRLCNLYNIPFHTTAKSAQNLESEIHNMDIFSRMKTENGLKWRKKSIEDFKRVFGWDITIELGEMFQKENEVIENNMNDVNLKEAENVSRETNESETTKTDDTGGGDDE
jgi:hypothetical protein